MSLGGCFYFQKKLELLAMACKRNWKGSEKDMEQDEKLNPRKVGFTIACPCEEVYYWIYCGVLLKWSFLGLDIFCIAERTGQLKISIARETEGSTIIVAIAYTCDISNNKTCAFSGYVNATVLARSKQIVLPKKIRCFVIFMSLLCMPTIIGLPTLYPTISPWWFNPRIWDNPGL